MTDTNLSSLSEEQITDNIMMLIKKLHQRQLKIEDRLERLGLNNHFIKIEKEIEEILSTWYMDNGRWKQKGID